MARLLKADKVSIRKAANQLAVSKQTIETAYNCIAAESVLMCPEDGSGQEFTLTAEEDGTGENDHSGQTPKSHLQLHPRNRTSKLFITTAAVKLKKSHLSYLKIPRVKTIVGQKVLRT